MTDLVQSGVKLADVAGSSLQKITSDVRETARLMSEIALAMQQQNSGSQEVLTAVSSVVESTQEIRTIAQRQRASSDEMREKISTIVGVFTEIRGATEEQARGNEEILQAVNQLQEVAAENMQIVGHLQNLLGGFQLGESTPQPSGDADVGRGEEVVGVRLVQDSES
jgi:methyl-accepting chemotaxis protein